MSSQDVFLIFIDPNINLITIANDGKYTFPNTKILKTDYIGDDNIDNAALNSAIRLAHIYNLNIQKNRLYDASLRNINGDKLFLFIYKLDNTELSSLVPKYTFVNINRLPITLDTISSTIAITLTNNFNLIRSVPNPPTIIYVYPQIIPFVPIINVPILRTYKSFSVDLTASRKISPPKEKYLPITSSISKTRSPRARSPRARSPKTRSPKARSPKARSPKARSPKARSPKKSSPLNLPIIHKIPRKMSPIKSRQRATASDTSSVSSKSSKSSNRSRKQSRSKRKGGYYSKYLKYKIKYLESEKQNIYLTEKIKKYINI
jgi:hypothetical protein